MKKFIEQLRRWQGRFALTPEQAEQLANIKYPCC